MERAARISSHSAGAPKGLTPGRVATSTDTMIYRPEGLGRKPVVILCVRAELKGFQDREWPAHRVEEFLTQKK